MNHWYYNNKRITSSEQLPTNTVGIVYLIENLTNNKSYVGKKILQFKRKTKTSKKERTTSRKKSKIVTKDSGWLSYTGSSVELNEDIKKGHKIKKTILRACFSKAEMSYWESKEIFLRECLETEDYYNKWISVRVYKKLL